MAAIPSHTGQLCCGAKSIAAFVGATPRQVYHFAAIGLLPHFHVGRTICARRSTLLQWIAERDGASQARPPEAACG